MKLADQTPQFDQVSDFGMEAFGMGEDFNINLAFQEAIQGVASDTELALEEKVRRMEVIVTEGTSEVYRNFVDFSQMAAQMEMMCSHDHSLNQSMQGSDTLFSFMNSHKMDDGHDHGESVSSKRDNKDDDEYEIDPKTRKKTKKKKRSAWFSILLK